MIRVYIAGPYTKGEPVLNTRETIIVATRLLDVDLVPFVPHLSHFWHFLTPRPYEVWIQYDMAWLEVCDCLLKLPGDSSGADDEVAKMKQLGKPVFYEIDNLLCWAAEQEPEGRIIWS